MAETVNTHGTSGDSLTEVLPPADFSLYHARRDLIAKRNATADLVKRERINLLIEQLTAYEREKDPDVKDYLARYIERQMTKVML